MVHRIGNLGIVTNTEGEIFTFDTGSNAGGWSAANFMLGGISGSAMGYNQYISTGKGEIIPYGPHNDMPGYVRNLLENFYAGEGIMGKKAGLQWGEGPRLYEDAVDEENNLFYRRWSIDKSITSALEDIDYTTQMHRCLVDLCHLEGFWVKITLNRGSRLGDGKIVNIEHVSASKVRYVWPGKGKIPIEAMVADWPYIDSTNVKRYPIFSPANPLAHPVSLAYFRLYSFGHDYYSVPRYIGAFGWLELADTLAPLLRTYNANASAISKHIESPQAYWDDIKEKLKTQCLKQKIKYTDKMLEDFKSDAMEEFANSMTGKRNAGKFIHTSRFYNEVAHDFDGWKITSIDNKLKEYIEAQMLIAKKSEAAATSGFGLDPSLSNLILDTKLGSGSEKLYALKVFNATETSLIDMVLCKPWQLFIDTNYPDTDLRLGLYRTVVDAEKNVNPENRIKANV